MNMSRKYVIQGLQVPSRAHLACVCVGQVIQLVDPVLLEAGRRGGLRGVGCHMQAWCDMDGIGSQHYCHIASWPRQPVLIALALHSLSQNYTWPPCAR